MFHDDMESLEVCGRNAYSRETKSDGGWRAGGRESAIWGKSRSYGGVILGASDTVDGSDGERRGREGGGSRREGKGLERGKDSAQGQQHRIRRGGGGANTS